MIMEQFRYNKNGIRIRVCCASCEHCIHDAIDYAGEVRKCSKFDMVMKPTDLHLQCYQMSSMLEHLAISDTPGMVKRKDYIKLVTSIRANEALSKAKEPMSCDEMREIYTSKFKESVYMNEQ